MSECSKYILLVTATFVVACPLSSRAQTFKDLYEFGPDEQPVASLLYHGGELYGKTEFGGAHDFGIVFGFDLKTATGRVVLDLPRSLDDAGEISELAYYRGFLYGTGYESRAYPGGEIYKVNPRSGHASAVAGFTGSSSTGPQGLLTVGNMLYGTSEYGGVNDYGSLYSVDPATRVITTLYQFGASDGLPGPALASANGMLYGVGNNNSVFAYNIATGAKSLLATLDDRPQTGVIYQGGYLYGTAAIFDGKDNGEIYRVDVKSGQVSVLYKFQGGKDGLGPISLPTYNGGVLYGTTYMGGSSNVGTAFAFNLMTNTKRIIYNFGEDGSNSGYPQSNLIWIAGALYGLAQGGANSSGLIFSLQP